MALRDMRQLEVLHLDGASVTDKGVTDFNRGLPNPTAIGPLR